jgi:filamentous hemagglutinin family protein
MARWRILLLTTTALMAGGPAWAGPDGANVVGGSATITGQGSATVTINQTSDRAIINWRHFNIGAGELTQFNQPSSGSVALNRVTGGLGPTEILGTLRANGRVFVVNQDGIYFGPNSVVDTAGFLATTSDIRNDDFMAGRYNFNIPGRPDASIVNQGTITAHSSGFAALVAPGVRNTGTITATLGTIGLASGNSFTLDFYGDRLITLAVGDSIAAQVRDVQTGRPLSSLVENAGKLSANGGRVELTAAAARRIVDSVINNRGVIEANRVGTRGGRIVLSAATGSSKPAGAPKQTIRLGGTLSAAGKKSGQKGGKIVVTGENIEVAGARIDVSGPAGGGTVLIGGDWGGGNPNQSLVTNPSAKLEPEKIANAATVTVDAATTINASATESGNGGKVILWADDRMTFAGTIEARGGPQDGDGGFAEVSGKQNLSYLGTTDLRAPRGQNGTLLLDPTNYTVWSGVGPAPSGSAITNTDLQNQLASASVIIATNNVAGAQDGDIFVNAPVVWNAGTTLTLSAFRHIVLPDLGFLTPNLRNTGAGSIVLRADNTGTGTGTVQMPASTNAVRLDWTASTGTVSVYYNPTIFGTQDNFTSGNGRFNLASPSQLTAYMLVNSGADLQNIGTNTLTLSQTYAIGRDFDGSIGFNGFVPGTIFAGVLDGSRGAGVNCANAACTIDNLTLSSAVANTSYGLFPFIGTTGVVRNLNLTDVNITAGASSQFLGAVAGQNSGTIQNVTVTNGVVDGDGGGAGIVAGGLVGQNNSGGTISGSHASVQVTVDDGTSLPGGWNYAGGLVGINNGDINASSAGNGTTVVSGLQYSFVGGLVGQNNGNINNSQASVLAFGTSGTGSSTAVGGFVGANTGNISNSSAASFVGGDGTTNTIILGGFVGLNGLTGFGPPTGTITNSQATGGVTAVGEGQAGGFAGGNFATIQSSSASSAVVIEAGSAGGFVGLNASTGAITNSQANGVVGALPQSNADVVVGGFAGDNQGTIATSSATGVVTAFSEILSIGGFVGTNAGQISNSSAAGWVFGEGEQVAAGGFAGENSGAIENSVASGLVQFTGTTFAALGGFVGFNEADIVNSYATGSVFASGAVGIAGGFVGINAGFIDPSFALGSVDVSGAELGAAGGFAGLNTDSGQLQRVSAQGPVIGGEGSYLGGLVGGNTGEIFQAYANGPVIGGANSVIGALIGANGGSVDQTYASGPVSGGSGSTVDRLVGTTNFAGLYNQLPNDVQQLFQSPSGQSSISNSYCVEGSAPCTGGQLIPASGLPSGFTEPWTRSDGGLPCFEGQTCPSGGDFHSSGDHLPNLQQYLMPPQVAVTYDQNPTLPPSVVPDVSRTNPPRTAANRPNTRNNQPLRPDGRPSNVPPLNETRFISNQVIVQIGANVSPALLDRVVRSLGLKVLSSQTIGLLGTQMIQFEFGKGKNVRDVIIALERLRVIDEAAPNYEFELAQAAGAPAGNGSGDPAQYVISKLKLAEAHRIATGENVLVAVIDSEIDAKHPDLEGRIAARYEEVGPVDKPHPHGTGMAGAIVSHRKLMGTAPGARILAIRAFGGASGGAKGTTVQIVKGLDWAVSQNARIVNMSFAGPKDPTLAKAFKAAFDRNVVLIAAAGNAGPKSPPLYPGADPNVIAVSATDGDDKIYTNSNRGNYISVAAPGVDILVPAPDGNYEFTTGTSVAAAHVSGVAALLLQRDPKLDAAGVREILTSTANPLGQRSRSDDFGYGLVDPIKALQAAGAKTAGAPVKATVAAAGR